MFDRNKLRQDAEHIRVGERVVMKRWLCRRKIFFDDVHCQDTEYIAALVDKNGGDSEALKREGRKRMVDKLCQIREL
jgi:hypothetical protein